MRYFKKYGLWLGLFCWNTMACAGNVYIVAASSLQPVFKTLSKQYQVMIPNTQIQSGFGASGALLQQIHRGAPVDIFISADKETMQLALAKKLVEANSVQDFAQNQLVLIVPSTRSMDRVRQISDLKKPTIQRIAIGLPKSVPAGRYAITAMQKAQVYGAIESKLIYAQSVRQVLDYVVSGEVDAGMVYLTDALSAHGQVRVVSPLVVGQALIYQVALTPQGGQSSDARAFVKWLSSAKAQVILRRAGFGAVDESKSGVGNL